MSSDAFQQSSNAAEQRKPTERATIAPQQNTAGVKRASSSSNMSEAAQRMQQFLDDRRVRPRESDLPLLDRWPGTPAAIDSRANAQPSRKRALHHDDDEEQSYSVNTPAPKRRAVLRSRIRTDSFFDESSRGPSDESTSLQHGKDTALSSDQVRQTGSFDALTASTTTMSTATTAAMAVARFESGLRSAMPVNSADKDAWRRRAAAVSCGQERSNDATLLQFEDDDVEPNVLEGYDDEGLDEDNMLNDAALSPYRAPPPPHQRQRRDRAGSVDVESYDDDEDADYDDKDPSVRRRMLRQGGRQQQPQPQQRREQPAAPDVAVDERANLTLAQRKTRFGQHLNSLAVGPPRQESMHGVDMVRPLDTHVQQSKMQAMGIVMGQLGWPPLSEQDSKEECLWVLQFLENAFRIVDYADEQVALLARINSRERLDNARSSNQGGRDDDDDEDASVDAEAARDRLAAVRRGPGSMRDYQFLHSDDELRRMSPYELCLRRFGLDSLLHNAAPREQSAAERARMAEAEALGQRSLDDGRPLTAAGEFVDVAYVETITAGMHAYLAMLKRNMLQHFVLMPYQAQQRRLRAVGRALESARAIARHRQRSGASSLMAGEVDDDDDEDAVLVPRHLNQRLQQLHNHVSNMRVMLRSLNLFGSSTARPRGLPLDLLAQGMQDAPTNTQSAVADPKSGEERQEALLMLLQQCYVNNWRRCGDQLYEEVMCNGHSTQAYKQVMSIEKLVWKMPNPLSSRAEWIRRTKERGVQKWMEEYLTNAHHDNEMLPDLERSRNQWSFRNGIYTASDDRFWEYGRKYPNCPQCPFNTNSISAKFFDLDFDPEWMRIAPSDIVIEPIETIFKTQKWSPEMVNWAYVMFGRLFYDVGTLENWQVAPFFLGMAGTGKSTLLEALMHIYDPSAVGTLSNNMEEKFGLMSMYDKNVVFAPEVRNDFRLQQADYQCMVSGERMAIPRKNKEVKEIPRWTAPFCGAGNEAPSWGDAAGALARRFLVFLFNEVVPRKQSRPNLRNEILKELPKLIVKANRYYKVAVYWFGEFNIWDVLPKEFLQSRATLRKATDHVAVFLGGCTTDERAADQCVTLHQFIEAMKAYGRSFDWKRVPIDADKTLRSLKQSIADMDEDTRERIRIEYRTNASGVAEHVIWGIKLPENVDVVSARLSNSNNSNNDNDAQSQQ